MNKLIKIFQLICICIPSYSLAQSNENVLNMGDHLLNTYLSKSLDSLYTGDSYFSGIYYIKFTLSENGEPMDIKCSDSMPENYKNAIEGTLKNLSDKWDSSFLEYAYKSKRKIVQPVLIETIYECPLRKNFYTKKLEEDSIGSEAFKCDLFQYILVNMTRMYDNTIRTFQNASKFENERGYFDCILMPSCVVIQKAKKIKHVKKL